MGKKRNLVLLALSVLVLPLVACAAPSGSESSPSAEESISFKESSSLEESSTSEELFVSNVSAVFLLDPNYSIYPDRFSQPNPQFFAGYETYEEVDEAVRSIADDEQYAAMEGILALLYEYMSSSDDSAFVVWNHFPYSI